MHEFPQGFPVVQTRQHDPPPVPGAQPGAPAAAKATVSASSRPANRDANPKRFNTLLTPRFRLPECYARQRSNSAADPRAE